MNGEGHVAPSAAKDPRRARHDGDHTVVHVPFDGTVVKQEGVSDGMQTGLGFSVARSPVNVGAAHNATEPGRSASASSAILTLFPAIADKSTERCAHWFGSA